MTAPSDLHDRATRYLLGLLPAAERERWEEALLVEGDRFDATLAAEDDLLDAYARGELTASERAAFERSVLPRRHTTERLAFARALAAATDHEAADRAAAADGAADGRRGGGAAPAGHRRPAGGGRPGGLQRWAAAAVVVLLGGGASFLGWRNAELAGRLAEHEGRAGGVREERSHLAAERDRLAERLAEEREAWQRERAEAARAIAAGRERGEELAAEVERLRGAAPPAAVTVSYLLALATRSGDRVPELVLPAGAARVRLQLDTGAPEPYASYRATLLAPPDGRVAWSRSGLRAAAGGGSTIVELELPAEVFVAGRHELLLDGVLAGEREAELVGSFEIELVRR